MSFANRCDDIAGTRPKSLFKASNNLGQHPVEGSQPSINKFQTTRQTNPLNPEYKLPSALEPPPYEGPRFIRNVLDIRDIEGSKAKKDPWYNKVRNVDPYTDIDGSHPK